ncbi:uncharacterized protein [Apostichopus japonicus]|uniref:uncharacterized protein isoform X2 n=1 Tax=Stichopus japonicus TaxID=307972 RepID=UPI003AB3ECC3
MGGAASKEIKPSLGRSHDSKSTKKALTHQINTLKDKVQELSHKLTESDYEKQQLTGRPNEVRQRFNDKLAISEGEKHQNIGRLKFAEEERRLSDKVTESEDKRQHFIGRLNTTEEERQPFKDTLNTTENKLKTLKDETEELLQQQKETSSTSVTEEDTLLGECETLDKSHQSTLAENATPGLTSTNEESNSVDFQSLPAISLCANGFEMKDVCKSGKFKIKPFRLMVHGLEKCLDNGAVTELAQLTEQDPDFVLKVDDLRKPFHHLMANWEKEGIVKEDDVDTLVELLNVLEAYEALDLVMEYQASFGDELTENRVSSKPQDIKPSVQCSSPRKAATNIPSQEQEQHRTSSARPRETFQNPTRINHRGKKPTHTKEQVLSVLQSLGIDLDCGKQLNVLSSMTLESIHLCEDTVSPECLVTAFLSRLMSYDYRSLRLFKEHEEINMILSVAPYANNNSYSSDSTNTARLSCRDIVSAIIIHCDPFLRQEVLSKMSACQLAVPVILPQSTTSDPLFLLWGLQKISKAWKDPSTSLVNEVNVTQFPFPIVAAVRFGNPGFSKSNTLNKLIGSVQGNDEHPYFCSQEQDIAPSILSRGTVEAVWYLPSDRKSRKYTIEKAVCFLNLRGDAVESSSQFDFLCTFASITLVFVNRRDVQRMLVQLNAITRKSQVLLILSSNGTLVPRWKEDEYVVNSIRAIGVGVIDTSQLSQIDVCEKICDQIKGLLNEVKTPPVNLHNTESYCANNGFVVDISFQDCSKAKQAALNILQSCRDDPKGYKPKALPLQVKWQKWSQLDKDRSWKGAQGNVEKELAMLHKAKNAVRQQQRDIGMSNEMRLLYEELLSSSSDYKQFLVFLLQHILNEVSIENLRPVLGEMKATRDELRETAAKVTNVQRRLNVSSIPAQEKRALQDDVRKWKSKESELQQSLLEKTKTFDASSLGFEHFVREFGQIYECFHNTEKRNQQNIRKIFDVKLIPQMAAEMLLSGHPLEIFDGDACHVPIKWVKGILAAVRGIIGDASVYVISVIGIQSSGKSTLLNSMFGVRFAVSAGRCTRGVFMQLLPIADSLKEEIGRDYIVVIDTEGLKAPEKAVTERKSEDNELATFALCLSDMTLINIGGQTVGEDLSNILQISAHAFIRMKEVHLRSSCYLLQQFVADVTAQYRNQSSTQSILQKLDQAVITAATEERKEDQYRQFSDCFNIVNIDNKEDNVQYIPSLWRGSMSSPNHDYSETVLKLKSALLREVKDSTRPQKLSDFEERISSVWNAVKQEDFVFNFRNTTEISQYNTFSQMFKRLQLRLNREMMKWELEAKQQIRNSTVENIEGRKGTLLLELEHKMTEEMSEIRATIGETLQEREFESVRHHSTFFYRDLDLFEKNILDTVKKMIQFESDIIGNATVKENQILPKLKADLRRQILPVAEKLQNEFLQSYSGKSKEEIYEQTEELVKTTFEEEWSKCMRNIELVHPTKSEERIRQDIEADIYRCVQECLQRSSHSMAMKDLLNTHSLQGLCEMTPPMKSERDAEEAFRLIGPCDREMTKLVAVLLESVETACGKKDFQFSEEFLDKVRRSLASIVSKHCPGCRDKTALIVILSCNIVKSANVTHKQNILKKIIQKRELLNKLKQFDVCTEWKIKEQLTACLKSEKLNCASKGTLKRLTNWVITDMFGWGSDNSDENFLNKVRVNLHEITSRVDGKKWYSYEATRDFVTMVSELLKTLCSTDKKKREHLQCEACGFYIQEAVRSEMDALADRVSWNEVQAYMDIFSVDIIDQMTKLVATVKDLVPVEVVEMLVGLSEENIQKFANMVPTGDTRHTLDKCFMMELPMLERQDVHIVLSIVAEARQTFLAKIKSNGSFNSTIMRDMITSIDQELSARRELGQQEQIVAIAYLCSWAFPICVDVQTTFERENSVTTLLEKEKHPLYQDFKTLCDGTCKDHMAAKSFSSIIEESLKQCLQNRICTAMFERLSKAGDEIFCSRPRFLKAVLENLCEEEDFENYIDFLRRHSTFLQTWTLSFIAKECCVETENFIRIKDIAMHEIGEILRETGESLDATLRSLRAESEGDISFEKWVETFTEYFETSVKSSLNEEDISEMNMYTVIADYDVFGAECKNLVQNTMQPKLLQHAELPDTSCIENIKEWFEGLPKQLHIVLAHAMQGCGTQCPFCKTLCDDTVKEHKVHFSNLHFPIGVGGWRDRYSTQLVCDTCTANVASSRMYYTCHCLGRTCAHSPKPYKEYRIDYPEWDIKPISNYEATLYWKWVLSRFNDDFARYYNCKRASIPWGTVTKEEALSSIRNDT